MLQNNGRIAHQEVDHVHFHVVSFDHSSGNRFYELGLRSSWRSGLGGRAPAGSRRMSERSTSHGLMWLEK